MPASIDAVIDHVAVAVPDRERAERRWRERLGGGRFLGDDNGMFRFQQLRYRNGGTLELIAPSAPAGADTFLQRFLRRFGAQVHHVTLKVPDLLPALEVVEAAGLQPVDVRRDQPFWHEAFLRPSQVGGLVVQIAWSPSGDGERIARQDALEEPAAGGAALLGPRLLHPDLEAAARLWAVLGATVERDAGRLVCRWTGSPMEVLIEQGEPPGPVSVRMRGTAALPAEEGVGPPVELA